MAVDVAERPGLRDVRCGLCARLLFKAAGLARIEMVCPNCKRHQTLSVRDVPPRR